MEVDKGPLSAPGVLSVLFWHARLRLNAAETSSQTWRGDAQNKAWSASSSENISKMEESRVESAAHARTHTGEMLVLLLPKGVATEANREIGTEA